MRGFVPKTGRPTKGGSLLGSRVQHSHGTPPNGSQPKQHARDRIVSPNGKSNGSTSNGDLPVFLRDTIQQLIASESAATSGVNAGNGAHKSSDRADDRKVSEGQCSIGHSAPLDSVTLAGSHSIRMPLWKRVLDLACVFIALPIWLPVTLLLMLWVKLASSGPVFYRQRRVGYRGEHFLIFKFRTMHVNAETRSHEEYFAHLMRVDCPMTKLDHAGDSRLIPGARFLRASGLDELPQIFNVIRGEMSLVGPRPCLPGEFAHYEEWQRQRVNAPPGITGYWQVNGKNKTTFQEMIAMDLLYARNMSIWADLGVMLKTVPVLVKETLEACKRFHSRKPSSPVLVQPVPVRVIEGANGSVREL